MGFFSSSCEWATSTFFLGRCVTNFHRVPIIAFLIAYYQCINAICKSCWLLQWLIMSHLQLIMSDSQVAGCDIIGLFIVSELSACDHVKIFNCWPCNQQLLWNHVGSCAFLAQKTIRKNGAQKVFGLIRGCRIHVPWIKQCISRQLCGVFRDVIFCGLCCMQCMGKMGLLLFVHDGGEFLGNRSCDMAPSCSLST